MRSHDLIPFSSRFSHMSDNVCCLVDMFQSSIGLLDFNHEALFSGKCLKYKAYLFKLLALDQQGCSARNIMQRGVK